MGDDPSDEHDRAIRRAVMGEQPAHKISLPKQHQPGLDENSVRTAPRIVRCADRVTNEQTDVANAHNAYSRL